MPAANWLLWIVLSAVAAAAVILHYRRRETPGRGRLLLALLRTGAIALLLLILFSPELPGTGAGAASGTQVLLDASLSMDVPGTDGRSRWEHGVAVARNRAGGRPVLLFGETPRPAAAGDLPERAPGDGRTLLLPAVQAAAEAGVRRVIVVTDGGVEDVDAVVRWAPRLGIEIVTEQVGDAVANRSLAEVSAPSWAEAGQPITVEFGVAAGIGSADSGSGDSITVIARTGGRTIGRVAVPGSAPGRLATGSMELRVDPPAGGGWVPLELALEGTDAVPDDDQRTVYVHVSEQPAGIVLISFRPDWEPRFLAPVLEQSLGLPLRGWIRSATGQYARLGGGLDAGQPATEAAVAQAVQRAELVVLHGVGPDVPPWAVGVLGAARRILIFPAESTENVPLPVAVGTPVQGDFFPAAIPASPVAALLAGQELTGVTPLASLRTAEVPDGGWAPLMATRGRQGAPQPLLVAGSAGGRRWVVSLGSGYWQWAFRGGNERLLYARLWSGLGGWLVGERGVAGPEAVRPERLATPRGAPVSWVASGLAADSLAVQLQDGTGAVVLDTVVTPTAGGAAFTAAPGPGDYSYRARAFADGTVTEGSGLLTVERFSPEFARPPADLSRVETQATAVRGSASRRGGTPLHATPVPYVLLVLLLATEWILRRRWGLR